MRTERTTRNVRDINAHLSGFGYAYVSTPMSANSLGTDKVRITRIRTRKGTLEGHVLSSGYWVTIAPDAWVTLS